MIAGKGKGNSFDFSLLFIFGNSGSAEKLSRQQLIRILTGNLTGAAADATIDSIKKSQNDTSYSKPFASVRNCFTRESICCMAASQKE